MSKTTKGGTSLSLTLFIIFLILKLTGYITWSWWWVTCPLWIGIAAGVIVFTVGAFISLLLLSLLILLSGLFGK